MKCEILDLPQEIPLDPLLPPGIEHILADKHQQQGEGAAQEHAHEGRAKLAEAENLKVEERKMVYQHQDDRIVEKPFNPLVPQRWGIPDKRLRPGRDGCDHEGTEKGHDHAGRCIQPDGVGEDIDTDSQEKGGDQEQPAGNSKGHQQDEIDVKVGIDVPPQVDMIQDQHLEKDQEKKPDDVKKDGS